MRRADERGFQNQPFPGALAFFGSEPCPHQKSNADQARRNQQAVGTHQMARADDDLRDERQRAVQVVKDVLEFGDEESQQHHQHAQREHKQNARIQHRRQDFRFQILLAGLKFRNLRQHHVEKAARLARLHHRDIHARKSVRRLRHRVRQRQAVNHEIMHLFPLRFRRRR